ncbi:hypothetical protein [Streptomyces lavendulae]|uniref:hypothetical protein n=1 Tax=Streptomyces lavendulae TaxID=1914 RepID=UPI003801306C
MGQSLSHRPSWLPWGRKGSKQIGVVVVIVVVAVSLSLALPAAQIAACTGLFSAIASVVVLIRRTERGALLRQA